MKTLYLERSTGECRKGDWVEQLDLDGVERIVVGTGPGSFAGIRSALAFAQGYALGRPGLEVLGLPSACAVAGTFFAQRSDARLLVIGDARQGKLWVAEFEGLRLLKEVYQIESASLASRFSSLVASSVAVVSPDERRIGAALKEVFGGSYLGERLPTAEGLKVFAEANPGALVKEPLPIYLNPAVRN